ncbi:Sulfatase [Desulfonispora thiosulfatigenes DSM 11270]|uniref:Sulfatase n=1 Tax=Desulfonispora thiosulfatigenes DSM 11270 TaxID=656914 RepID=A0A1W1URR6_DESTI|nr:LTA synthase family protein [Desulfonispora thiosulfatigenes]SMB83501.1 Sulfatase [Desulfonispora thiosulfatigenes DSM 11270]
MLDIFKNKYVLIMALAKITLFYYLLGNKVSLVLILLSSVFFISLIYTITSKKTFLLVNFIISFLMFVDVIYMNYYNQYLSFSSFKQIGQLSDISETIMLLIKPTYFLLFLDLFLSRFIQKDTYKKKVFIKAFALNMVIISLLIIDPLQATSVQKISNQEFFTYHVKNAYNILVEQNLNDARIAKDLENKKLVTSDENSKLHGVAKGRNLIIIQVESFQNMLINAKYNKQELTPNLNKLIKGDTIYFKNYYQQVGLANTSDAEFISNNALHPNIYAQTYDLYKDNYYYGLPWILKDEGYKTLAFHAYKKDFWNRAAAYPNQGFDEFISQDDFDNNEIIGFGLSDREFFKQSLEYLEKEKQPFYSFLVTLTSHNPYVMPMEEQKIKLKN